MNLCPLCKQCYQSDPRCGLTLFHSENECAICLEKCEKMIALPCGHQFCQEDLEKIGIFPKIHIQNKKTTTRKARRCGWCGHLGHTIRQCDAHREECGCTSRNSTNHMILFAQKPTCQTCHKRGHATEQCEVIVLT